MASRYYRSRHKLLRYYRRLMLAGLVATVAVAVAMQPGHGSPVGAAATWTHVAAVAPICWLWLTHPRFAVKLLFGALAGTLVAGAVANWPHRPRYR
jgi:hypothetical protein